MRLIAFCATVAVLAMSPRPASPEDPPGAPDQAAIDAAIDKGTKWLLTQSKNLRNLQYRWMPDRAAPEYYEEFVLYTLTHAGVGPGHPIFDAVFQRVVKKELKKTYHVACQAMALEAIDKKALQGRIAQCAQFLVDNQLEDGGWGYGEPTTLPKVTFSMPRRQTVTRSSTSSGSPGSKADEKKGTIALPRLTLKRQRWGKPPHDNSNVQIALLGLRSCIMSGIQLPDDTLPRAAQYLRDQKVGDGAWGYRKEEKYAWGSMVCGAVSSLAICDFYIPGKNLQEDPDIKAGLEWMAQRWTWDKCPDQTRGEWQYYYIYGVERVGMLVNAGSIGGHDWYAEGAKYLLAHQRGDGSWEGSNSDAIPDTCFAILFLKKATRPLQKVYTK